MQVAETSPPFSGLRDVNDPSFASWFSTPHHHRWSVSGLPTLPMASYNSEEDGFRLRSYQTEMVDASIERNIIVAVCFQVSDLYSWLILCCPRWILEAGRQQCLSLDENEENTSDSCQSHIASTSCIGDKRARKGSSL